MAYDYRFFYAYTDADAYYFRYAADVTLLLLLRLLIWPLLML